MINTLNTTFLEKIETNVSEFFFSRRAFVRAVPERRTTDTIRVFCVKEESSVAFDFVVFVRLSLSLSLSREKLRRYESCALLETIGRRGRVQRNVLLSEIIPARHDRRRPFSFEKKRSDDGRTRTRAFVGGGRRGDASSFSRRVFEDHHHPGER